MKKAISFILCIVLLTTSVFAAQWPAWGESASDWAVESGVSEVFTLSPETLMTRAMTARLFYELGGSPEYDGEQPFTDVSGPDADAIFWAAQEGLVTGVGGGRYEPERPVTRQEFAVIVYRRLGAPHAAAGGLSGYTDRTELASWAYTAMNWCVCAGVVQGKTAVKLVPGASITTAEALLMAKRAGELPDLSRMEEDLAVLTDAPRPIGSEGEAAAARYLERRFTEMGYTVTLQPYTDAKGRTGTNVIAVKKAAVDDADILVLSAHHDSVPTACGANDNASGVAALLFAAEALKDISGDTELRFISFTDEENGKNGSRFYTGSLSGEERERMVGDIQFDMLGGLGSHGAQVCTADGQTNWVSDILQKYDGGLSLGAETASDHSSFQLAGVPSVLLMQKGRGYLYHSAADTADQLDLYAIARAANAAVAAAREIASLETPSYLETAHAQGENYSYCQTRQNVICFDSSLSDTEAYIGAAGELVDHYEVSGNGSPRVRTCAAGG